MVTDSPTALRPAKCITAENVYWKITKKRLLLHKKIKEYNCGIFLVLASLLRKGKNTFWKTVSRNGLSNKSPFMNFSCFSVIISTLRKLSKIEN